MILTLQLDAASESYFNQLRAQYFPPELNFIAAHVTLFHSLPDDQVGAICLKLQSVSEGQLPIPITVTGLRNLGRGVAFTLESPSLSTLRRVLAEAWRDRLTPQDIQKFKPHITVQNKVTPEAARATLAFLQASYRARVIHALGLQLWEYRNGPWSHLRDFPFLPINPTCI